ncbi:MAG: TRAP transporter large permease [Spirochaetales bacterium]|nr:TRAP transporter large permease [Spirochaetales bacterium]
MITFVDFLPLILAITLLFLKVPMAISFFTATFVYFGFISKIIPLTSVIQNMVSGTMSTSMVCVPLFMMVGIIMQKAGIADNLMGFCSVLVGHHRGGLAHVNVLLSTLDGGVTTSSNADCAMQCKILVPEMTKQGYPVGFSAAVTAASALIAPIVPPGANLILYAIITETSVGALFMAGYIPALILCVLEMIVVTIAAKKYNLPKAREKRATLKEIAFAFKDGFWAILIGAVLIFGLRFGLFTIMEGGTIIIVMSFIVGFFVYKTLKIKDLFPIFKDALHSTCSMMLMFTSAKAFGLYLSCAGIPKAMTDFVVRYTSSQAVFMILCCGVLFVAGMFLNGGPIITIMAPILFPIAVKLGIHPVEFGIVLIVMTSTGAMTPPVGGCMYVCMNLLHIGMPEFQKYVWPFICCFFLTVILLIVFPSISLFIPRLVYGMV